MRARAHELIAEHAHEAHLDRRLPEMQHLARDLFHLARQCGAAGLHQESRELLTASKPRTIKRASYQALVDDSETWHEEMILDGVPQPG